MFIHKIPAEMVTGARGGHRLGSELGNAGANLVCYSEIHGVQKTEANHLFPECLLYLSLYFAALSEIPMTIYCFPK